MLELDKIRNNLKESSSKSSTSWIYLDQRMKKPVLIINSRLHKKVIWLKGENKYYKGKAGNSDVCPLDCKKYNTR